MNKYLSFTTTDDTSAQTHACICAPNAETVLSDTRCFEQRIVLPKYSIAGAVINEEYAALMFHFLVTPIYVNYADFRLTADNRYELLGFDGDLYADFSETDIEDAACEMEEAFDDADEPPTLLAFDQMYEAEYSSSNEWAQLQITMPTWAQAHYEDYTQTHKEGEDPTDYNLPVFRDENGEQLAFIGELYAGDVFGSYYLFFSPKTRLVRQFFQCT